MKKRKSQWPLDIYMRIVIVSLLIAWCFFIARPFLVILTWSVIISVAIYPLFSKLVNLLGGRKKLAVGFFMVGLIALFAVPILQTSNTVLNHSQQIKATVLDSSFQVPPPNPEVRNWPIVGKQVYGLWNEASIGIQSFIENHKDEATKIVTWLFSNLANIFTDGIMSILSLFLACLLMYHAENGYKGALAFCNRLIGDGGELYVNTAKDTIRSVVQGILLIAIIQSVAAFIGFKIIGLQAAALLSILVLILAVIQLPVILVTLPAAIYVFSVAETTPAILFAVYMIVIGLLDNLLKPIFLGRGLKVPMVVVLIGSLGGLLLHGILGLFVGPVVLAIGYQTYQLWLNQPWQEQHED